ncbi:MULTISPECIES: hypothetical protein [unclassified Clostridium]|uniref:hypothetical protein n=1 Tax=unclassified Clostridium TaxID=2614128 RepID=UPI0013F9C1C3|nr:MULTISPECIES: hypothetical protein [unclassified Clostridium]NFR85948.1 hypothetical protein [Clostridium botulinum]NFR91346.1 hypothetical protein [Clostridium botulinum]NFU00681.1 hypothetical protein [Clostridium botulinum]
MGNSKYLLFVYLYCFVVGFLIFLKGYKMYKTKKYLIKLKNRVIKDEVKLSKYEGTLLCVGSIMYIIIVIVMLNSSPIYHDIKDYILIGLFIGWVIVFYIIHFIFLNLYTTKKKNKS